MFWRLHWLAALCCLVLPAVGWSADLVNLPSLSARVTDLTGTLTADQVVALEAATAAIETEKGAQVVVLLLPSTQPEAIEQFGIRLAEAWRIGRQGVNDGVIVIVAKNDRKMRIEVAYGLEGAIPDAVAKRIIDERMAPRFKQGDFAGGLQAAVEALAMLIRGEALPAPAAAAANAPVAAAGQVSENAVLLLFLTVALSTVARQMLGVAGSLAAAAVAGWLAWAAFATWLAVAIAAGAAFLFSFARSDGGWHSGGSGGGIGSGGFSSSSGGGYSGGGGDFGGGGASGSW